MFTDSSASKKIPHSLFLRFHYAAIVLRFPVTDRASQEGSDGAETRYIAATVSAKALNALKPYLIHPARACLFRRRYDQRAIQLYHEAKAQGGLAMTMELITPYRAAAMDMGTLNCPTFIGHLVVEHGTLPMDELYEALRMASANAGVLDYDRLQANQPQSDSGDGFQLYAIGDAVSCRNIYAAIYDALPLCKDL